MRTPTHSLISHFRAYRAAVRAIRWAMVQPAGRIVNSQAAIVRHFGGAY